MLTVVVCYFLYLAVGIQQALLTWPSLGPTAPEGSKEAMPSLTEVGREEGVQLLSQSAGGRLARLEGPKLHTAHEATQHLAVLQVTRIPSGQHIALGFLIEQPQDLLIMDLELSAPWEKNIPSELKGRLIQGDIIIGGVGEAQQQLWPLAAQFVGLVFGFQLHFQERGDEPECKGLQGHVWELQDFTDCAVQLMGTD